MSLPLLHIVFTNLKGDKLTLSIITCDAQNQKTTKDIPVVVTHFNCYLTTLLTPPLLLNESYLLQLTLLIVVFYLFLAISPLTLWMLSALFLVTIGLIGLSLNLNILIGFLWVIDLGVGLIFLVFVSNLVVFGETKLTPPSQQSFKALSMLTILGALVYLSPSFKPEFPLSQAINPSNSSSHLNYYLLFSDKEISQLNLLREIFFYNNAWEFILINYLVLSGLIGMVVFNFSITTSHRQQTLSHLALNIPLNSAIAPLFIRDQNFVTQQQTSHSVRLWEKTNFTPLK